MDPRGHVNDIDDSERQLPPLEHAQQDLAASHEVPDLQDFLNEGFFEADYVDDGAMPVDYDPKQAMTEPLGEACAFPSYGESAPSSNVNDNTFAQPGHDQHRQNSAAVNGYIYAYHLNTFADPSVPASKQPIAKATYYPPDPYLQQNLPPVESTDFGDLSIFGYPNDFNNQSFDTYPVPSAGHTTGAYMDPTSSGNAVPTLPPVPTDFPKRTRRRRRTSTDSIEAPDSTRVKKQCLGCDKPFCNSKDPGKLRCTRCYDKHVKHTAGPTNYTFDPSSNIESAWRRLYPDVVPISPPDDDVHTAKDNEQDYIRRLVEAVSTPYTSDGSNSKENQQRVSQQEKINKKPFDSTQYRDDLVNARIRFLFHITLSVHAGGRSYYDVGGDNSGYGDDKTLIFSARMEKIIQLLTLDKDIAMDVIEGRGVVALVRHPNKYERRKRDNKKSNDTKQDLQEKGK